MSDKSYFHEPNPLVQLRIWALGQMLWGAFLAAVFLVAILAFLYAIWGVGLLLPEESKQAPSPYAALVLELPGATA